VRIAEGEKKEATARLLQQETRWVQRLASLAPLPESRPATGNLFADACSIQDWA